MNQKDKITTKKLKISPKWQLGFPDRLSRNQN